MHLYNNQEVQCQFEEKKSESEGFLELKKKFVKISDQLIKLNEKNKKVDKAFLGNPYETTLLDMIKFSLLYSDSEFDFLKELDAKFQDEI